MKSLQENLDLEQNFLMSLSLLGDSIIIMLKNNDKKDPFHLKVLCCFSLSQTDAIPKILSSIPFSLSPTSPELRSLEPDGKSSKITAISRSKCYILKLIPDTIRVGVSHLLGLNNTTICRR